MNANFRRNEIGEMSSAMWVRSSVLMKTLSLQPLEHGKTLLVAGVVNNDTMTDDVIEVSPERENQ